MPFTTVLPCVTPIKNAEWVDTGAGFLSLFFSKEVMLQTYIPTTKRSKPYVRLICYEPTERGYIYGKILWQKNLPDNRDKETVKKNALYTAAEHMHAMARMSESISSMLYKTAAEHVEKEAEKTNGPNAARFINDDKMPKAGIRTAPTMTVEELEKIIAAQQNKQPATQAQKDLEEITITIENVFSDPGDLTDRSIGTPLLGPQTLPNGFSFHGFAGQCDWSLPMFYIRYYDGKQLRIYVPSCGNLVNLDTMSALGMEDDSHYLEKEREEFYEKYNRPMFEPGELFVRYMEKYGLVAQKNSFLPEVKFNWDAIANDIMTAISVTQSEKK